MTPEKVLKAHWGHDAFRPMQREIIASVLEKKDTLAILPTGGGKSVCFQVPGLLMGECCLVISPLIALMEDQVMHLREKGIGAATINSGMSPDETESILQDCEEGDIQFLYISPERLASKKFIARLVEIPLSMVAVDEAHCISQWGYDFRPSYLQIHKIREYHPQVPIIALTASATGKVKADILEKLKMRTPATFMTSFARANLAYQAIETNDKINKLLRILQQEDGAGIVYCKTRKRTKELSDLLKQHGIETDHYHAGLDRETRKAKQDNWVNNRTRIMVCTNAFGMGIDKADVRFVVHADIPDCLENYYQEAGRAGRDGNPAKAILLSSKMERNGLRSLPDIKFPSIKTIRKVYHALANYLQIPTGEGLGRYYDFDLEDFLPKFRLELHEVINSLQALKQEGIISYLEQVYMPSRVHFIAGREFIERFEDEQPALEPMIKALLRTYSGIVDIPVKISEAKLAWLLKRDQQTIHEQLALLRKNRIIEYEMSKDLPQLCYLQERIKADELNIRYDRYIERKKEYATRIEKMIGYAEQGGCRAVYIGRYFEDTRIQECGICDNCNALKVKQSGRVDERLVLKAITEHLQKQHADLKELSRNNPIGEEQLKKGIAFLLAEETIGLDKFGRYFLK